MNLSVLIILALFIATIEILVVMKNQNMSFTVRVLVALGIGLVFGGVMQVVFGYGSAIIKESNDWIQLVGTGYVRLLKMIVMPLIFISILSAFITQKAKNLGSIAGRAISVLLITVAISAVVGAVTTSAFKLDTVGLQVGEAEKQRGENLENQLKDFSKTPIQQQILEIIPTNPFAALAGNGQNATLATVFFAAMLAIAAIQIRKFNKDTADKFESGVKVLHDIVMRLVAIIMRFTPYGVLALMIKVASTSSVADITRLLKFILASYVAMAIMFGIHLLIISIFGFKPGVFVKKTMSTLLFAFTSRTSAGTLPFTIKTQKDALGVPEGIANLSSTLGVSIGQNGCAGIYPAMLAVMIAPSLGINPLNPVFLIKLTLIVTISSFGIAGVGGGATFAALTVLSALGFPIGLAGLLIAIEPLIDMARTALNVSDSIVSGLVTAKTLNEIDMKAYNDADNVAEIAQ